MTSKFKCVEWSVFRLVANQNGTPKDPNIVKHLVVIWLSYTDKLLIKTTYSFNDKEFTRGAHLIREHEDYKEMFHAIKNDLHKMQITRDMAKLKGVNCPE